MEMEWIKTTIM